MIERASRLIVYRDGAPLTELRGVLRSLLERVLAVPNDLTWPEDVEPIYRYAEFRGQVERAWPELGFHDADIGGNLDVDAIVEVGDAIDDLTDIAVDLDKAMQLARVDEAGAWSWLRFAADVHWGEHVLDLDRHLARREGQG